MTELNQKAPVISVNCISQPLITIYATIIAGIQSTSCANRARTMNSSRASDLKRSTAPCLGTLIGYVVLIDVTASLKSRDMGCDQNPIAKCEGANIDWREKMPILFGHRGPLLVAVNIPLRHNNEKRIALINLNYLDLFFILALVADSNQALFSLASWKNRWRLLCLTRSRHALPFSPMRPFPPFHFSPNSHE